MNNLLENLIYIVLALIFLERFIKFLKIVKKYINPYKLIMIFGKKGSGKTTLLAKLALQHLKKGWTVYSSIELNIPGVRLFNVKDIGPYAFPEHSVIFIDEVGMIWDNRDFKNFKNSVRDYFKYQRHYKNKVYLFSQTFDVDVKLRNLTDYMFMCRCIGNVISIATRISRKLVVVETPGESEGRITDGYEVEPLWLTLIGMKVAYFTWIPKYSKYFCSHELLADVDFNIPYQEVSTRDDASSVPYITLKTLFARNRPRLIWRRAPKDSHNKKDADSS